MKEGKNEKERLAALHSYHILDTAEEKDYDDLTALASAICMAPIAIISMVDENRQWFKSHHGIDAVETPIEHSICKYAITAPGNILIVPDAKLDQRFCNNPLVTGKPHIIFYAGIALINTDGFALGSLCVIDHYARELSNEQISALTVIAKQVIDKLELRRKMNELKRSEDERRDFVANISHDLRTPLSIVKGYTETLLLQQNVSPETIEYLQLIEKKIKQLENLVTQLFDLSKMDAVEFKAQKEPFIIGEVLKEIATAWQRPAQSKNIFLKCSGCEDTYMIFADVSLMERAIHNLLDNAVKYTPEDGFVTIQLLRHDRELILSFMNNGPRVPEDVVEWISHETKHSGIVRRPAKSGLGLAIVKRILELHNYSFLISTNSQNRFLIRMNLYATPS